MIARSALLALSWGVFSAAPVSSSYLPPQLLPVYGGSGGTSFTRDCGSGRVLTGLRFRSGLLVDAVGILCRPVLSDGALGHESIVGTLAGGGGGTSGSTSCKSGRVLTKAQIYYGSYVQGIFLTCKVWDPAKREIGGTFQSTGATIAFSTGTSREEECEAATQPMAGIQGRAHSLVDAIGFICDEP